MAEKLRAQNLIDLPPTRPQTMPPAVAPILGNDVPHLIRVEIMENAVDMIPHLMPPNIQQIRLIIHLEIHITEITKGKIPMGMARLHQAPLQTKLLSPGLVLLPVSVDPILRDHSSLKSLRSHDLHPYIARILCEPRELSTLLEIPY
ncbi:hypothetical protein E3J20_04210 [Candidatus Bathyarchaeota archaeon]|nr:MAG: hypothetical protein E3J20_04210 [Candidatus Bathyarchaeota archaeon]